MGKGCPKEKVLGRDGKQNRRLNTRRREYLRPGALAQLRYSIATCTSTKPPLSAADIGMKKLGVLDSNSSKPKRDAALDHTPPSPQRHRRQSDINDDESSMLLLSPQRSSSSNAEVIVSTPKTPQFQDRHLDSNLESLPMDILVKILCHLHHDQLRPVFHVCPKIRKAVIVARQFHFNYTTPNRDQQALQTITPLPTEQCPFLWKGKRKCSWFSGPRTPKAPKQGPRPPRFFKSDFDVRQITAALFQESLPSTPVPSGAPKSACKPIASNRALFCEDELCQAVAQNKLR